MSPASTGGFHPATAALKNTLAAMGVANPYTGKPFSEALLLGIGGGLGAGYILWEFEWAESAIIVMGFRNRWNYTTAFLTNLCERLGARVVVQEAGGKKAAEANLQAALDRGLPFLAWVDKAHLPHQCLPEALKGYNSHVIGVFGRANGGVQVDDLADGFFEVPPDVFAAGRARIPSDKNRLLLVEAPASLDLPAAVRAGALDCADHLGRDSDSFALPVYRKWARLMTDRKNKKGWPVVFQNRKGLFGTLRSVYEGIRLDSTEGCGLRRLYADFLDEAAEMPGRAALQEAAPLYRQAADAWLQVADAALPPDVFGETRALMDDRYRLYRARRTADLQPVIDKLETQRQAFDRDFPLDDTRTAALFESLQAALVAVYDAEVKALETLRRALD